MNVTKVRNYLRFSTLTVRDYVPQKQDFKIGEVTEVIKSKRSGVMHTVCTVPTKNVILCEIEQRAKSWKMSDKYEFSKIGMINTKYHITKDVQAKKYFQRIGKEGLSTDNSFGKRDDKKDSPFSDSSDDFEDWDDF